MRERGPRHLTLQTTALVHEAFLKIYRGRSEDFESHAHFLGVAAKAMRSVIVDYYRASRAEKRGGDRPVYSINAEEADAVGDDDRDTRAHLDLLALEHALHQLEAIDERKVRLVELRFYGGLTNAQAAEVLGLSRATVERDWRLAKAFLKSSLQGDDAITES